MQVSTFVFRHSLNKVIFRITSWVVNYSYILLYVIFFDNLLLTVILCMILF